MTVDIPRDELTVAGRTLAFAEYGAEDGFPVLFFHGNPGSRVMASHLADAARERGVRLVAPERPGFGHSDPRPERTIDDWTDDVAALTAHLGVDRFAVVGHSAGGPHALACGADGDLQARVEAVGLLAGVAPPDAPQGDVTLRIRLLNATGRTVPWALGPLFSLQARVVERQSPAAVAGVFTDREVGDGSDDIDPATAETVKRDVTEAFAGGTAGAVRESVLMARSWDVDLAAVDPPVVGRYGTADRNVPPAHGEYLAERLPDADVRFVEGGDHLTVLAERGGGLLDAVTP